MLVKIGSNLNNAKYIQLISDLDEGEIFLHDGAPYYRSHATQQCVCVGGAEMCAYACVCLRRIGYAYVGVCMNIISEWVVISGERMKKVKKTLDEKESFLISFHDLAVEEWYINSFKYLTCWLIVEVCHLKRIWYLFV